MRESVRQELRCALRADRLANNRNPVLYAARDEKHNEAVILADSLNK